MRLARLDLIAFGAFENRSLDLSDGPHALHLVYGPNEAGKSTVLRALHALLFGFPRSTSDGFRFETTRLRVGALLETNDGRQIELIRRKGNRLTLANAAGERLTDDVLIPLLGTVDEAAFTRLFGLDGERLRTGAAELQHARGEVGQSLFEAGSGAIGLRRSLAELETRSAELFSPRAEKPLLNRAILDLEEARRATREDSLSGTRWRALGAELDAAEQEERRLHDERVRLSAEAARLRRVQRAQRPLARRRALMAELESLRDAPDLPETAHEECVEAERRRDRAASALAGFTRRTAEARHELDSIVVPHALPGERAAIERQIEEIGTRRKHESDLPKREGEVAGIERESRELLRSLWPGRTLADSDTLRRPRSEVLRVRTLAGQCEQLAGEHTRHVQQVATMRARLRQSEEQLAALPASRDLRRLELALAELQSRALHEDERLLMLADVAAQHATLLRDVAALPAVGVEMDVETLAALRVPSREALDRMAEEEKRLHPALARAEDALTRTEARQHDLATRLSALEATGPIPSHESLATTRERRDALWRLVRRGFVDGDEDVTRAAHDLDPDRAPADAFERAMAGSDEIADALAADSARVATSRQLASDLSAARETTMKARAACDAARETLASWESAWCALWREVGIEPRSTREMEGWWRERTQIVARLDGLARRKAEADAKTARIEHSRLAVNSALRALGESVDGDAVDDLVACSQRWIAREAALDVERRSLHARIAEWRADLPGLDSALAQSERAVASARAAWADAIAPFGLPQDTTATEANDVLDRLETFFQLRDRADAIRHRIEGMRRDLDQQTREVESLCAAVAPDLVGQATTAQVAELKDRLAATTRAVERRAELEGTLERLAAEVESAQRDHELAEAALAGLRRLGGAHDDDALHRALQRAARKRCAQEERARLEEDLTTAEAHTPDELERESAQIDLDALPVYIEQRDAALAENDAQARAATERRATLGNDRARHEAASGAIDAEQRAQEAIARIERHAEDWTRLRLAAHVLRETIERYRQANQGPIVERMSALMPVLTRGAFCAVEVMHDEDDTAVLVGVRASGERVAVAGMSEGTRDQLFLALRLAAIERHLDAQGPMPIVLDDVLVHFDDARARPALELLSSLAQRTQVLCFTHHAHLVTLAREAIPPQRLVVHTL